MAKKTMPKAPAGRKAAAAEGASKQSLPKTKSYPSHVVHPVPASALPPEHPAATPKAFQLSDSSVVGTAEVDKATFEGIRGKSIRRHELNVGPSSTEGPAPRTVPAPLD
jgi:hypothetical protein